jgi:plastocyanin
MKQILATLALATVALAAAACSATNADSGTPAASIRPADPNAPVIDAKDMGFPKPEITVTAGRALDLTFDNEDGAPHNVAIYTDASAATVVFRGEIFNGPATKVYSVPALASGTCFFRCDAHPGMQGTIVAR